MTPPFTDEHDQFRQVVRDFVQQFHGGIGYMEETWTARFLRDNRLTGIGGGADEVMLRVLAQLDGYTA